MATIDYLVRFHQGIHARNPQHKKKIFHSKGRHFEYSCVKSLQQKAAWLWLHRCLNRLAPTSRHHSLYWPLPLYITLSIGPSLSTSLTLLAPPSLHHSLYWPLPIYITLAIIGFSSVGSFIITSMHVKERRPDWAEWGQWSDGESIRPIKWTIRH